MLTLPSHTNQCGAALIVSMMMLVAITLIGVAVMGNSRLEWLMTSNSNAQTNVITSTQTALGLAENRVITNVCTSVVPLTNCNSTNLAGGWDAPSDGFYDAITTPPTDDPRNIASWSTIGADLGGSWGRYLVIRRACAHPPGYTAYPIGFTAALNFTSATCGNTLPGSQPFTDIYDVWVMSSDNKTNATRIARSTFVTVTHPGPPGSPSVPACGGLLAPPNNLGLPPQSTRCRIGYTEITS